MLSVHDPNAEEKLDAGIIKIRVQTCESASKRRRDTGRRSYQIRVQTCKSASSGTERKDQIRVLQTKTASEPFTIRNILSEGSEVQSPLAPGRQTRASVINSKTASETASENQTGSYPVLMVLLQKKILSFRVPQTSSNGEV